MPAQSFELTTETQIGPVDTGGIGAAISNFLTSFPEFIPIALAPKVPPLKPTEITSDPDAALKAWIPATIYCSVAAAGSVVIGSTLFCSSSPFTIADIIRNFISAFFSGWWLWYTGVKVHWSDRRCPCCLGSLCYLIMACLYALQFLGFFLGVIRLAWSLLGLGGTCFIYMIIVFGSSIFYLPMFYLALANLFIYQKASGQTIISADQVAAAQSRP
jgi:hypothetical protein